MLKQYLIRNYEYNKWANEVTIKLIADQNAYGIERIQVLLSHLIAAQEVWISRIQGRAMNISGVWQIGSLEENAKLHADTMTDWLDYLTNLSDEADLLRIISYKNTKGDFYETPIIDIANHCVGHASYHRAQIMQLLRDNGHEPFDTTFITYARLVKHPSL